ncbi:MAG: hypothetical protein GY874_23510 [Desulfobacteraceae bacterium]|nr:hypothetical protein [Desulfobacteraceae bacterium]
MVKQTALLFKLEKTKNLITPLAGLSLLGEFTAGLGILNALDKYLPAPGGVGYRASEHVFALILMLNEGGKKGCQKDS